MGNILYAKGDYEGALMYHKQAHILIVEIYNASKKS